jgi:sigma-B regulation protein RsbU (phosphoserine phosphatase)
MARDVITGLRVVLDVQYRLTRAIERVNRVVSRSALASRFITLVYAEFERNGNMVYCNAGHPPPLLFQDGQVRKLEIGGLLLGPEPNASYERGFERFVPGSTLLFYTDGIVEAQNRSGKEYGAARLEKLLRHMKGAGAAEIVDAIFAEVERFAPGPRRDDQTVVVVRRPA